MPSVPRVCELAQRNSDSKLILVPQRYHFQPGELCLPMVVLRIRLRTDGGIDLHLLFPDLKVG